MPILLFAFVKLIYVKTTYAAYLMSLIYIMVVLSFSNKKRNDFLKYTYNSKRHGQIRISENILVAFPFVLFMVIIEPNLLALLPLALGVLLSFYNNIGTTNLHIPTPFSKFPFEFSVGFRQYLPIFILQFLLIGIAIKVDNYNLAIVSYGSIFLVMMSFYSKMEAYFFVWVHSQSASLFINNKIKTGLKYSLIVAIIPLITLLIIYPTYIWISLLVTLVGFSYIIFASILKYAQFPMPFNLINIIITFISIGFPFIMIITIPYYYKKAIKNLKLELL
jgi:hypothetical protein